METIDINVLASSRPMDTTITGGAILCWGELFRTYFVILFSTMMMTSMTDDDDDSSD